MRYIVVTGGVISGIGKGITSSSLGVLFKSMGYVVTMIKIDPYLNVDAGTIGPSEHGECFVLSDGGECDLDLGNYERFLNIQLTREHNITTGRIYRSVIEKERKGDYLGATVQVVPHITDEIISQISKTSQIPINGSTPQICIIEIGGTVGDIEGLPFIEALQQMQSLTDDKFCFVHVAMAINNPEVKTKPIQHSVIALRARGIFPNILVVRSKQPLDGEIKNKLHRLCHINLNNIISNHDVPSIYHVSDIFFQQHICQRISECVGLNGISKNPYESIIAFHNKVFLKNVSIGIVGKYTTSPDTYLSLVSAIEHACFHLNIKPIIGWISSDNQVDLQNLKCYNCIIIPGGFGTRGISGKLQVAKYARENNIPILGICLGMQVMVVDCLKSIGINATSREWSDFFVDNNPTTCFAIDLLDGQSQTKGGTMRLGDFPVKLTSPKVIDIYKSSSITERHRHRYKVNTDLIDSLNLSGLSVSALGGDNCDLVEMVELINHPFYIGCQFHPEFKSYISNPHPLFLSLLSIT